MTDEIAEIPLTGGRVTMDVVRVGETVRRPVSANSRFVRRLLRHLSEKGFDGCPGFVGTDERGRDVFTYIAGDVPAELTFHDDRTLRRAASLIRRFHDVCSDFVDSPGTPTGTETVCHNDLSPCNFVFRDAEPVAMIDFDAAAPGSRARDLGYAAWLWLDLGSPEVSADEQQGRLATFLEAYGAPSPEPILDAMLHRQTELAEEGRKTGNRALCEWALDCRNWTGQNLRILGR